MSEWTNGHEFYMSGFKMKYKLFQDYEKKPKRVTKKKVTIEITKTDRGINVFYNGHNEGSSCTYDTEEEAQKAVKDIEDRLDKTLFSIKTIDERGKVEKYQQLLEKWKKFIEDYCKEKKQEPELIWFDSSVPYDCEISVRMKNHRCYNSCIDFRFEKQKLVAFDSHFGGGTSFVNGCDEEKEIKTNLDKVFNKKCSDDSFCCDDGKQREIKLDENGWETD